jgi:hypothetical protein
LLAETPISGRVEFDIRVPVANDGLIANVAYALSLGLPSLRQQTHGVPRLKIIANGPSADSASLCGSTLALNGALSTFTDVGLAPTYWAACDPQPIVASFLDTTPRETTYLVASKCHPSVFDLLLKRRCNVILWHLDDHATWDLVKDLDPISIASSVTICAFELGERLGFSKFETWGWDGCYIDGRDHATDQPAGGVYVELDIGGQVFPTTRTWALEGQDAVNKLRMTPRDIKIHGPGMIGALLDFHEVYHGA